MTILSDSMAKYVSGVKYTTVQAFPGATVSRLQSKILSQKASIDFKYTILLIGTNDISSSPSVGEIISLFENLVTGVLHDNLLNVSLVFGVSSYFLYTY